MSGYLALVLHAHLPFVRHPENDFHLEEMWFFEALAECYLPLLDVLDGLARDQLPGRITLSISAPLMAMLDDDLLRQRFVAYLERTLELCARERERTQDMPELQPLVTLYTERYEHLRQRFSDLNQDILSAFIAHHTGGRCELITAAGTHALLPLLHSDHARRLHIHAAVDAFTQRVGTPPRGMWLPECAFAPGLEDLLAEANLQFAILEHHGITLASPRPPHGHLNPIATPNGVCFFGRDPDASKLVWSASEGYPGDPDYREFYRDVGFDLPLSHVRPFVHPDGLRIHTGLKYYRITGRTDHKALYVPDNARNKARQHAHHFVETRRQHLAHLTATPQPPIITCPYDAELFGHWWFEGPIFLDTVLRQAAATDDLSAISLGDYLDRHSTLPVATPSHSSWGDGGYFGVWLDSSNDWIYRHLHRAEERMVALASHFPEARGHRQRALQQAARELALAQASDWPFIIKTGTSVRYAVQRIRTHLDHFNRLDAMLVSDRIDVRTLEAFEASTPLFQDIDYHVFERRLIRRPQA